MQIADSKCRICERKIVFSDEGKFCAHCGSVVHLACAPQAECDRCNQPFRLYAPPEADPAGEAVIPPAMRTGRSGGPVVAVLLVMVLGILGIIAFLVLRGIERWRP